MMRVANVNLVESNSWLQGISRDRDHQLFSIAVLQIDMASALGLHKICKNVMECIIAAKEECCTTQLILSWESIAVNAASALEVYSN